MKGEPSTEWLMRHEAHNPRRVKAKHPWRIRPRKCDTCKNEPPACRCKEES